MFESIISYLWQAFSATLLQVMILMVPGLLLSLILNFETRFIQGLALNTIGIRWYLGLFGWLGTVTHECGHAVFCIIFGHKITDIKLFRPDPETGTLGYVKHSYNPSNIYHLAGNFFIGTGPILVGTAVIFLLSLWLLDLHAFNPANGFVSASLQLSSWGAFRELWQGMWVSFGGLLTDIFSLHHLSGWQLYVFIYLVFTIGSSITLSPPDIKSALTGSIVIVTLLFILNLALSWAGNITSEIIIKTAGYYVLFYTLIFLVLIINIVVALLIFLPLSFLRHNHAKTA